LPSPFAISYCIYVWLNNEKGRNGGHKKVSKYGHSKLESQGKERDPGKERDSWPVR
jgi:hypothetical protein